MLVFWRNSGPKPSSFSSSMVIHPIVLMNTCIA